MRQQETACSASWSSGRTGLSPRALAAITLSHIPACGGDRCAAGSSEQCGVFTPQIQRWPCSEAILVRQLRRQSRWRNKNRQRMRFKVTLASKRALPSCWHVLCLKNGAEETCLPLNQGWRCKDLMPTVVFFSLPGSGNMPGAIFCFLEVQEKRESHVSGSTAGLRLQVPTSTLDPQLDPALGLFYPVPHPCCTHQDAGMSGGHPTSSPLPSLSMHACAASQPSHVRAYLKRWRWKEK